MSTAAKSAKKWSKDRQMPPRTPPVEIYTLQRKAEFLLNNAVGPDDYANARKLVQAMGLDPDRIDHVKPEAV